MTGSMKRMGLWIGAAAIVAAVGGGAYAAAQDQNNPGQRGPRMGRGGPGGPGRGGMLGMLPLGRLNLTDAQRDQVRSLAEAQQAETQPLAERARTAREALQAAVTADVVDEGAIRTRHAELATIESDLAVARARLRQQILQILTPEQRAELKQLDSQRGERRRR